MDDNNNKKKSAVVPLFPLTACPPWLARPEWNSDEVFQRRFGWSRKLDNCPSF